MRKRLLFLGVILTLTLTACADNKEETKAKTNNVKVEETKTDQSSKQPNYDDFEIVISEEPTGTYGKFDVTNNSEYSIEYFKLNYSNDEGKEYLLHTSTSMLPSDTAKGNQFMLEDAQIQNYKDYKPEWCEVKYLDENKESHTWRYDIKLDKYNNY